MNKAQKIAAANALVDAIAAEITVAPAAPVAAVAKAPKVKVVKADADLKLTVNEVAVVKAVAQNDFKDGDKITDAVPAIAVVVAVSAVVAAKSVPGVLAQLKMKGILDSIKVKGQTVVNLTAKGVEFAAATA